jgi:Tol biopolymer transport system component
MAALPPGESKERDLTWLDWSAATAISPDGRMILFSESGEGGGAGYAVYLRKTDGSPAVRLGEGFAQDLSPDGKWALAIVHQTTAPQLAAYPTGAGELKLFPRDGLSVSEARWLPDGKRIAFTANEPGRRPRLYLRDFAGGRPRVLSPEGYEFSQSSPGRGISPDSQWAFVRGPDRKFYLYPISGGEPTAVPGIDEKDSVAGFGADGRSLYVYRFGEIPLKVYRTDLSAGRRQLWRTFMPADAAGVVLIYPVLTPSGESYAYSYLRTLSDLYLLERVK